MICGIIAEFNPFHNGHRALIEAARAAGADSVICVMSGNFAQRGAAAITDKRVRARAALESGADLIFELPLAASVSTAQRFARGAVHLLLSTGCVEMLAFGSESGDISGLKNLSKAIDEPEVTFIMRRLLKDGLTFAKARQLAVAEIYGDDLAAWLSLPNNLLGVEYLRQMDLQKLKAEAFTVPRTGAEHHSISASGGYASASYLRANADNPDIWAQYVPAPAFQVYEAARTQGLFPSDSGALDTAILSHLRRLGPDDLAALPDISEGIENRMFAAIRTASMLPELEASLKTKRYTMARIRRLVLSAFLGLSARDCDALPPYLRVIGFNSRGRRLLTEIKKRCRLPLSASLAELRERNATCERFAALEEISTDLYGLTLPSPPACGYEYTAPGIFLE